VPIAVDLVKLGSLEIVACFPAAVSQDMSSPARSSGLGDVMPVAFQETLTLEALDSAARPVEVELHCLADLVNWEIPRFHVRA
jgi:hypothetical protein